MKRYELAVIKSAFKLIFHYVKPGRIRLSADRGFPDDDLFALLDELDAAAIIALAQQGRSLFAALSPYT
jgi:hypothetical protein